MKNRKQRSMEELKRERKEQAKDMPQDVVSNVLKKLIKSRKGFSISYTWVFALVSLFGIGVLYVVFNQVFLQYLVPTIKNAVNTTNVDPATVTTVYANIDKYMFFWTIVPYILFGAVVLYLIVAAIRRERDEELY